MDSKKYIGMDVHKIWNCGRGRHRSLYGQGRENSLNEPIHLFGRNIF